MTINPQFIRAPDGTELVVITRAEFDALTRPVDEDEEDLAIFDQRMAELKSGVARLLPVEVTKLMLKGDSLFRALRKWRGLNQFDMVGLTGLSQGFLSDLESGKKKGTPETLEKIAAALKIDRQWLDFIEIATDDRRRLAAGVLSRDDALKRKKLLPGPSAERGK
jgi:transcriptional regulator with XRE-family HTH domain